MSYQDELLNWYDTNKRDLPWRNTTTPWHIIVSEIMLQQTQVDRVLPKYESFLKAYPTPQSCAKASVPELLSHWQGLGYNRRALYLKRIAENFPKELPRDPKDLQKLPGIGLYTANAILAFTYNDNVMVNDTNIQRALSRIKGKVLTNDEIFNELPHGKSRDWYNALMDFGALICHAQKPACTECPIKKHCKNPGLTFTKPKAAKFEGSNRMYRGKLLRLLLAEKKLSIQRASTLLKITTKQTEALATELAKEGFLKKEKTVLLTK